MRIAVFLSHPIQHFSPLWRELSGRPGVRLKTFYYCQHGVRPSYERDFGVTMTWNVDLLAGHDHEFLPRRWPTRDPLDSSWKALNRGFGRALSEGWDVAYVAGYVHLNNWIVAMKCRRRCIPVLCQGDNSILTAFDRSPLRLRLKAPLVRRFIRMLAGCLAIGDCSREYFLHYGADPDRTFFVPIPVDVDRFRGTVAEADPQRLAALRAQYGIPDGKRIVTFSGKLIPRKRPQDLVDAILKLNRPDVVSLLIGDGPMRAELEARAQGKTIITGFVNQAEIPLLTSLGAVSVMPSSYDAHPLAVTEALCLGIPVLLSDRCGCYGPNDVLRDGEDGFVYRCGDVDHLVDRLAWLLDHPAERERMGARARELADTQSPAAAADRLLDAAHAVAAGPRASQ